MYALLGLRGNSIYIFTVGIKQYSYILFFQLVHAYCMHSCTVLSSRNSKRPLLHRVKGQAGMKGLLREME